MSSTIMLWLIRGFPDLHKFDEKLEIQMCIWSTYTEFYWEAANWNSICNHKLINEAIKLENPVVWPPSKSCSISSHQHNESINGNIYANWSKIFIINCALRITRPFSFHSTDAKSDFYFLQSTYPCVSASALSEIPCLPREINKLVVKRKSKTNWKHCHVMR